MINLSYTMIVFIERKIQKIINKYSKQDRAKIHRIIELFEEKGFLLSEIHLKKLTKNIWELRPGNIRLLFGIVRNKGIITNVFIKKTNKIPSKKLEIVEKRLKKYI